MKKQSDLQVRKFNPGTFQSDQAVIEQFVVRNRELGTVLDVLRGNINAPSCQHMLVVAPRGRGKSMLLARVVAELRTNEEFCKQLFPVRFMEESQEIFNIADFWLESLFHLARELAPSDPEFSRELQSTHDALTSKWRDENLGQRALATVLDAADRLGMQLVIMVENLQALCEDTDEDFGWQLRKTLQSENQIMLMATATSHFEGLEDAQQPFFELFQLVCLQPLDTEECRRLWQVVSGDAVSGREIRPLQILTGGSPRLLVIVADFARHRSLRQLMEELVALIDNHTEYFRSHLESLAKGERRVYLAVIDLWQPSATGEIAARARMDVRTVSTLLGRLVNRGAVIVEGSGKKRLYAAAERLYSIYYKLRRERDEAAVVQNLVHFMVVFYNRSELVELSRNLVAETAQSPGIRDGIERAVAKIPELYDVFSDKLSLSTGVDDDKQSRLFSKMETAHENSNFQEVIEIADQLSGSFDPDSLRDSTVVIAKTLFIKALAQGQLGESAAAIATYDEVVERFAASEDRELQKWVAGALVNKGVSQGQLGESAVAIATYDEVVERFAASDDRELQEGVAVALVNKGISQGQLGESAAAIVTYDEVVERFAASDDRELQTQVARALVNKGIRQGQLGESAAEIATYDGVVERFAASDDRKLQVLVAMALVNKGFRQGQLGESAAAIATYDEVVERFAASDDRKLQEPVARALVNKGFRQGQLGESAAAIATYDEVVERFAASDDRELQKQVAMALVNKGETQVKMGLAKQALDTSETISRDFSALADNQSVPFEWHAQWIKTKVFFTQKKLADAIRAFESMYVSFDPANSAMMRMIQEDVPELIGFGASENDILKVLLSDQEKCDTITPLVIALRQEAGEAVRAPSEVLEVAADIRERIRAKR